MRRQFTSVLLVLGLLSGCNARVDDASSGPSSGTPPPQGDVSNCPTATEKVALQIPKEGLVFEQLDFRPEEIEATADTVTFKNDRYAFIFCRANRSWTTQAVEPAAATESQDQEDFMRAIANPTYQTIELDGQTYEARVRLEAAWLTEQGEVDPDATPEEIVDEQVVFEMIPPGETEPITQVLYTLSTLQQRELGAQLGVPHISQALSYNEALWWSVAFERGEGASGIATIVQYEPETQELTLWQPEALADNQITDMVLTGEGETLTLWLGTQTSGEGNPRLPAAGLVTYQPATETVQTYTVHNSPLVGAIPARLQLLDDALWVGTGNGACEIPWQTVESFEDWNCWQFTAEAEVPDDGVPLYDSLLAQEPATTLTVDTVEVLWVADTELEDAAKMRYEVRYPEGFEATLDVGAQRYKENTLYRTLVPSGLFWPGADWHWNGQRFLRSLDEVAVNYVGGGPIGIGPMDYQGYINDWKAIRGDLELIELTGTETRLRYYSGWVDGDAITPYLSVMPVEPPTAVEPNPLEAIKASLEPVDPFPQ